MNDHESFRNLQLMNELEQDDSISQRELAGRLGVAVGLVNSYLKNLASKGFLRVKNYPRNRYAYLLTPKGLAEKSRLAYQHLHYFNNLYTLVRQDYLVLFCQLREEGAKSVVFCGIDEVAEIAYLSMQEAGLSLATVLDDDAEGKQFFGMPIMNVAQGIISGADPIVITSLKRMRGIREQLERLGVGEERVYSAGA